MRRLFPTTLRVRCAAVVVKLTLESERQPARPRHAGELPRPAPSPGKSATRTAQKTALYAPCEHNLQAPLFSGTWSWSARNSARADSGIMGRYDIYGEWYLWWYLGRSLMPPFTFCCPQAMRTFWLRCYTRSSIRTQFSLDSTLVSLLALACKLRFNAVPAGIQLSASLQLLGLPDVSLLRRPIFRKRWAEAFRIARSIRGKRVGEKERAWFRFRLARRPTKGGLSAVEGFSAECAGSSRKIRTTPQQSGLIRRKPVLPEQTLGRPGDRNPTNSGQRGERPLGERPLGLTL